MSFKQQQKKGCQIMPLQNYQYDTIMREYSKTQSQNRRILEERTQEIYEKIPRIREIDE